MPSFTTLALLSLSLPFTTLAAVPRAGYKLQDHYTGEDFLYATPARVLATL
jgi:hypothetical protein